jgi:hypothetical protein
MELALDRACYGAAEAFGLRHDSTLSYLFGEPGLALREDHAQCVKRRDDKVIPSHTKPRWTAVSVQ